MLSHLAIADKNGAGERCYRELQVLNQAEMKVKGLFMLGEGNYTEKMCRKPPDGLPCSNRGRR